MCDEKLCARCRKKEPFHSFTNYCFSCLEDIHAETLTENILLGETEETFAEDDIVCPWCGNRYEPLEIDESGSYMDEGEYVEVCGDCGRNFIYQASVSTTFSTRRS